MAPALSFRRRFQVERLEGRALLAAGALDTAFSGDGVARIDPVTRQGFITEDLCLQSDGKTVIVGNLGGNHIGGRVARYNVDGSLDSSFGDNGITELPGFRFARAVALQNTSIIVVGDVIDAPFGTTVGVARLTPGGVIDSGFGGGGYRVVDVPGVSAEAYDVVVQRDLKIVLVGESYINGDDDFIAVRFTPVGNVDMPFGGGDGVTEIDFTGGFDSALSVTLDYTPPSTDPKYGSIFLAGERKVAGQDARFAVAKLTPAGLLDNSFDGNGQVTTEFPGGPSSTARDLLVQPDGKLVVTGVVADSYFSSRRNFITARYLANGALDSSFGPTGTGYVERDLGGAESATGIAINYDGGLVISGQSDGVMTLFAYTSNGNIDTRFGGTNGVRTYQDVFIRSPVPPFNEGLLEPGSSPKVAVTGNTINPIRRILAAGGQSGQTLRVVDIAPMVTITAVDAEASENTSNTATFRISLSDTLPEALVVRVGVGGTAISPDDDRDTNNQDYNAVGIAFGNMFSNATVTIPAGTSSKVITVTAVDDTLSEGDETVTFSIASNAAYDVGSPSSASIIIRDNEPAGTPFTVSSAFYYETLPIKVSFTFSQNVGASVGLSDFVITTNATTPVPTPALSYNTTLNTATLSWAAPLPDGIYGVRVKASGINNAAGVHLNADSLKIFGVLAGDANGDGTVDFDDLVIVAQHYNETGHTFSGGNFDYSTDGKVDFGDLVILAQRYGTSLVTLAPVTLPGADVKPTGRQRPSDGLLD